MVVRLYSFSSHFWIFLSLGKIILHFWYFFGQIFNPLWIQIFFMTILWGTKFLIHRICIRIGLRTILRRFFLLLLLMHLVVSIVRIRIMGIYSLRLFIHIILHVPLSRILLHIHRFFYVSGRLLSFYSFFSLLCM